VEVYTTVRHFGMDDLLLTISLILNDFNGCNTIECLSMVGKF